MAYRQILWIKLEKRLLNDYRFYTLSRDAQLIYLKILMLSAETTNKIPKNPVILRSALRETLKTTEIEKCLEEIKTNFPKFKESKNFYFFLGWKNRHNWYLPSDSTATPELSQDKDKIKNKIKKKNIDEIIQEYIRIKGFSTDKGMVSYIYKRHGKAARDLSLNAQDNALECLRWAAEFFGDKGLTWKLETVVRWYPEWKKRHTQEQAHLKQGSEAQRRLKKMEQEAKANPIDSAKLKDLTKNIGEMK